MKERIISRFIEIDEDVLEDHELANLIKFDMSKFEHTKETQNNQLDYIINNFEMPIKMEEPMEDFVINLISDDEDDSKTQPIQQQESKLQQQPQLENPQNFSSDQIQHHYYTKRNVEKTHSAYDNQKRCTLVANSDNNGQVHGGADQQNQIVESKISEAHTAESIKNISRIADVPGYNVMDRCTAENPDDNYYSTDNIAEDSNQNEQLQSNPINVSFNMSANHEIAKTQFEYAVKKEERALNGGYAENGNEKYDFRMKYEGNELPKRRKKVCRKMYNTLMEEFKIEKQAAKIATLNIEYRVQNLIHYEDAKYIDTIKKLFSFLKKTGERCMDELNRMQRFSLSEFGSYLRDIGIY